MIEHCSSPVQTMVLFAFGQPCAFANTSLKLPFLRMPALNPFYQLLSRIRNSVQKMPVKVSIVTHGKEASILTHRQRFTELALVQDRQPRLLIQ